MIGRNGRAYGETKKHEQARLGPEQLVIRVSLATKRVVEK